MGNYIAIFLLHRVWSLNELESINLSVNFKLRRVFNLVCLQDLM